MMIRLWAFSVSHWAEWSQFGSLVSLTTAGFVVAVPLGLLVLGLFLGLLGWAYSPRKAVAG